MARERTDMPAAEKKLAGLRKKIDALDLRIVQLLNARTEVAVAIGHIKRGRGNPVFSPAREREVVKRVTAASRGHLKARQLRPIYREIMSAALSCEGGLVLGVLRQSGASAVLAARQRFGDGSRLVRLDSMPGLLTALRKGRIAYGLQAQEGWRKVRPAERRDVVEVETLRDLGWPGTFVLLGRKGEL